MTKSQVKIRRPYDASQPTSISFPEKTMAKQAFKDECNINTIMSKYQKTGLIEHVQKVQGAYGDFTSVQDYQLSLNQVIEAQEAFEALPAAVRKRFGNDPSHLMSFLEDPSNLDEAVKLGLVELTPIPQPKTEEKSETSPPKKSAPPEAETAQ